MFHLSVRYIVKSNIEKTDKEIGIQVIPRSFETSCQTDMIPELVKALEQRGERESTIKISRARRIN